MIYVGCKSIQMCGQVEVQLHSFLAVVFVEGETSNLIFTHVMESDTGKA
jgi:hypothetical protein